jgi:hypothetical protein
LRVIVSNKGDKTYFLNCVLYANHSEKHLSASSLFGKLFQETNQENRIVNQKKERGKLRTQYLKQVATVVN